MATEVEKVKKKNIGDEDYTKAKARYWVAVGYPENMRPDWQDCIDEVLEVPYCYCVHDKDQIEKTQDEEDRKVHVHIIIAFVNTTTGKHALEVFRKLNASGRNAFPAAYPIISIRHKYDYLIHRTAKAQRQGKYQYDPSERKSGNNFDIGSYEQISEADRRRMRREISKMIRTQKMSNFLDVCDYVDENMTDEYEDVLASYSGYFINICKGVWQRYSGDRR